MKHLIIGKILLSQVVEKLTPLKPKGRYLIGICQNPAHNDKRASMTVSDSQMRFKCFACGFGGDAIDFVMKTQDVDFNRAVAILEGDDRLIIPEAEYDEIMKKRNKKSFEVLPIADPTHKPSYFHNDYGMPKVKYAYKNLFDQLIAYTCRFEHADGTKDILPYTFGVFDNGTHAWQYSGFPTPRPIYGMQFIGAFPDATVIVVEGEKCADFGNTKIHNSDHRGKYVFVSWIGGSNAVKQTDFGVLADKNIIHWSDNDKPGFDATKMIANIVGGRFIHIPSDKPEKWDVADNDWSADELVDFIDKNTHPQQQKWKTDKAEEPKVLPPLPEIKDKPKYFDKLGEFYFRVLGYSKNEKSQLTFWFYAFDSKMVIAFNAPSLTKSNLMTLAPIQWWERKFPSGGNSKFDSDSAVQSVISACNEAGIFNEEDKIRGRGAWRDGDDVVLHVGNRLIVNGNEMKLNDYATENIYEINKTIKYGGAPALKKEESMKFLELMRWYAWDNERTTPLMFAGWLVIAPFCGVLDSRPNGWLTSTSSGGKTWIQDNVIKAVLGNLAIVVNSTGTSANGIRQKLQSDALPVLFDEAEAKDDKSRQVLSDLLLILRGAFQKDGGQVVKGSIEGRAKSFSIKTMVMFSSISTYLPDKADQRRCVVFNLKYDINKRNYAWEAYKERYFSIVTPEYIKGLQSRTIQMLPVIIHNAEMFTRAMTIVSKDNATGDLLGCLIAAAYSLVSDNTISLEDAILYVKEYDWTHEIEKKDQRDEVALLDELLSMQIKIDNIHTLSVGEMIVFEHSPHLIGDVVGNGNEHTYLKKEIKRTLGNYGIKHIDNHGVCFANGNPALRRLMSRSQWAHNIEGLLMRLPGAVKDNPRVYQTGQRSHRGICIPIESVIESVR